MRNLLFFLLLFSIYSFSAELTSDDTEYSACTCPDGEYFASSNSYDGSFFIYVDQVKPSKCFHSTYQNYRSHYYNLSQGSESLWNYSFTTDYCSSCPAGQEGVGDICLDKCEDNETRVNDVCEANEDVAYCNDGYSVIVDISTPTSCDNFLDLNTNENHYEDIYRLFPNTQEESFTCCVKEKSLSTDTPDGNDTSSDDDDNNTPPADDADDDDSSTSTTDNILADIKTDITIASEQAHTDSQSAIDNANSNSEQAHTDSENSIGAVNSNAEQAHQDEVLNRSKYDGIIIGLRDVVEMTSSIGDQAHADSEALRADANENAGTNHEDLEDIEDDLEDIQDALTDGKDDADDDLGSFSETLNQLSDSIPRGRDSILGSFNSLLTSYTKTPPIFVGTGKSTFSANVLGGSVVIDLSIFSNLKQYFDIIFTLMLAFINFKIYRWIFTILLTIGV